MPYFFQSLVHSSMDVKLATLRTVKYVAKTSAESLEFDRLRYLIPELISLLRDRNTAVRSLSELTLAFLLQLHKNDEIFNVSLVTSFLLVTKWDIFSVCFLLKKDSF